MKKVLIGLAVVTVVLIAIGQQQQADRMAADAAQVGQCAYRGDSLLGPVVAMDTTERGTRMLVDEGRETPAAWAAYAVTLRPCP